MDISIDQLSKSPQVTQPWSASLEEAARRKTKANTRVRLLTQLLAEAHRELSDASADLSEAKTNQGSEGHSVPLETEATDRYSQTGE